MKSTFCEAIVGSLETGRNHLKTQIAGLSAEALAAVPEGDAFVNSVASVVLHVGATEVGIVSQVAGRTAPDDLVTAFLIDKRTELLPSATGETVESLTEKLDRALAYVVAALEPLTDADLDREVPSSRGGAPRSVRSRLQVLPWHQGLHDGQIMYIKRLIGSPA